MDSHAFNRSLLLNILWSFLGRFGYVFIALISNIILVRLLSPTEFGQVSIIMFFIVVSNILIESGLSGALVRKESTTEADYSTVFIFNLAISLSLMIGLMISAKYIANFYSDSKLTPLIQLSSLVLIINALRVTQNVKLIRGLKFKTKSIFELISISIGSVVAIFTAMHGFGATSLVLLQLSNSASITLLMWFFVSPIKFQGFNIKSFKQIYKFGINTTLSALLDKSFDNGYQLILAKYFSINQSGYFYQAKKLQEMPIGVIQGSIFGVVYAALSKLQNNIEEFSQVYLNIVRLFTVVIASICLLIYYYADLVVHLLYGSQWMPSANYLQLLIIASFFYLQEVFNRNLFKIFDRTDLILKLELVKKSILSLTMLYGIWTLSITNLLYGFVGVSAISFLLNYHLSRMIYKASYWSELILILKVIITSIITITFSLYIQYFFEIQGYHSLILLPFILLVYLFLLIASKVVNIRQDFNQIKQLIKS
ncbi:lipopolysaccharide biosynthesis protein [Psychrobacter faecalis]|uniref:lipopolysaccharide biosynthesis protein n=1 Tax=Psychrobacter faecalis TaxID=180588 RepID=UPI0018DF66C9|nr:lipopolysaccharide biosynthesis protein [Psychrobacter faecalis]